MDRLNSSCSCILTEMISLSLWHQEGGASTSGRFWGKLIRNLLKISFVTHKSSPQRQSELSHIHISTKGYNLSNWKRRRNAEHNSGSLKNFLTHTQCENIKEMEQMLSECSFVSAAIDFVPIKFHQPQKQRHSNRLKKTCVQVVFALRTSTFLAKVKIELFSLQLLREIEMWARFRSNQMFLEEFLQTNSKNLLNMSQHVTNQIIIN